MSDTVKLKYEEEDLKLLAGFTLLDDDFMTFVFDRNIEATELVLNVILGRDDLKVIMFYPELAKLVRHFKETEGGRSQVCKAMEERINREKEKERIDNSFEHIKNLMEAMKMTAEQAMIVLKIPDADRAILAKKF